jgi:hypothetical protein
LQSFKEHFGENYYKSLGENFQKNQFQTVGF